MDVHMFHKIGALALLSLATAGAYGSQPSDIAKLKDGRGAAFHPTAADLDS